MLATCWAQERPVVRPSRRGVMNRDTQALLDTGSVVTSFAPDLAGEECGIPPRNLGLDVPEDVKDVYHPHPPAGDGEQPSFPIR
ncbi:unnamed protein product [Boreogadus saida]